MVGSGCIVECMSKYTREEILEKVAAGDNLESADLSGAYLGGRLQQSPKVLNIMNRIAAMVYMLLAVKLISAEI